MSANNAKVQSVIESVFQSIVTKLAGDASGVLVSDLFIQVDQESGEVQIFDDAENLLDKVVIFDWINKNEDEATFIIRITSTLKVVLSLLTSKGAFAKQNISIPFAVSLTDEDFSVIEELLFIDEEILRVDDPLLQNLDEDLDLFIAKLLSDLD
jgi:hypothetical protein